MPERLMGGQLIIWVDNSGSVLMFKKGYSTKCNLCCTLITAIHELSVFLRCEGEPMKNRQCSDSGSKAADHLSKNFFNDFHQLVPGARQVPEAIPERLIEWIMDPVPDRLLGKKILNVMSNYYRLGRSSFKKKNESMDSVQRGGRGSTPNPNFLKCIFGKGEILF